MYIADTSKKEIELKTLGKDLGNYFSTVDAKTIPELEKRQGKYYKLVEEAKKLEIGQCLKVVEKENVSLPAIQSLMRKEGYKVTQRKVNKKVVLFIELKPTEETEELEEPPEAPVIEEA